MSELKPVIDFLRELSANNGKPWFDAHKETYREVQSIFAGFTERFIAGVEEFDKSVSGLTVKECTWRIYRDIRFSADKTPYKTHFGAWVAPQGKKSGYAGYYIHIQPDEELYMICAGLHCPTPAMIRSVREEIMTDGDGFHAAVMEAGGFSLDRSIATKRVPAGYPADDKYADYYKLKEYIVEQYLSENDILSPSFLDRALAQFRTTERFVALLNRCVDFSREMGWEAHP